MPVVDVHVKSIRPRYNNLREWLASSRNVYIGRGGRVFIDGEPYSYKSSIFANPYKPKDFDNIHQCLEKYETHLRKLLEDPHIEKQFQELKGKNLGCWCAPNPCHGDIIKKILKERYY